ncbi:MAG: undecaprenyl-diphosphate phosphatase [Endomicrobiia bacterium]
MIQGITEFLPVSSSGHLVLLQTIFGFKNMLFYDVILHFATILAVFVLFFKEILEYVKDLKIFTKIIILTIPTGIIGLFIKRYFYFVYDNVLFTGVFLFVTGIWLLIAEKVYLRNIHKKLNINQMSFTKSIIIGILQGVAVLPGISRSAATLGGMLVFNFLKEQSVKFIFVASIPAVIGATLIEFMDLTKEEIMLFRPVYIMGAFIAFVFGLLSLKLLIKVVKKQKLMYFSIYCFIISVICISIYFLT